VGAGAAADVQEPSAAGEDSEDGHLCFSLFDVPAPDGGLAGAVGPAAEEAVSPTEVPPRPPGLRSLAIVDCPGIPADTWSPLWGDLPSSLTELDLSGNGLSDHAVNAVCGAFRGRHCPESLMLQRNRCKDIERLCVLIEGGGLHALDLTDNLLNDKSIAQLCTALAAPAAALSSLKLSRNRRVTVRGHRQLAEQLPCSTLRHLALDGTALCDEGGEALATALPGCALDQLHVEGTQLSHAGARRLLQAAQASPSVYGLCVDEGGQRVNWRRCRDPADVLSFTAPMSYVDWC